jgi:hypothetical protein
LILKIPEEERSHAPLLHARMKHWKLFCSGFDWIFASPTCSAQIVELMHVAVGPEQ